MSENVHPHFSPFRFSTKFTDDETELVYYGYRYYNPAMGRWLNRDPIGERADVLLYGQCANDTIQYFDYLGLERPIDHMGNYVGPDPDLPGPHNGYEPGGNTPGTKPPQTDLNSVVLKHALFGDECCNVGHDPLYLDGNPLKIDSGDIYSTVQSRAKVFCENGDAGSASVSTSITKDSTYETLGEVTLSISGNLMKTGVEHFENGDRLITWRFKGKVKPYDKFDFWPLNNPNRSGYGNVLNFVGFLLSGGGHPSTAPSGMVLGNFHIFFAPVAMDFNGAICCEK